MLYIPDASEVDSLYLASAARGLITWVAQCVGKILPNPGEFSLSLFDPCLIVVSESDRSTAHRPSSKRERESHLQPSSPLQPPRSEELLHDVEIQPSLSSLRETAKTGTP